MGLPVRALLLLRISIPIFQLSPDEPAQLVLGARAKDVGNMETPDGAGNHRERGPAR
jgi:hypothetical protein